MSNRYPALEQQATAMDIPARTLQRWAQWWQVEFSKTLFWRTYQGYVVPPVVQFPNGLLERFVGDILESMQKLLLFLSPLSVEKFMIPEGCSISAELVDRHYP